MRFRFFAIALLVGAVLASTFGIAVIGKPASSQEVDARQELNTTDETEICLNRVYLNFQYYELIALSEVGCAFKPKVTAESYDPINIAEISKFGPFGTCVDHPSICNRAATAIADKAGSVVRGLKSPSTEPCVEYSSTSKTWNIRSKCIGIFPEDHLGVQSDPPQVTDTDITHELGITDKTKVCRAKYYIDQAEFPLTALSNTGCSFKVKLSTTWPAVDWHYLYNKYINVSFFEFGTCGDKPSACNATTAAIHDKDGSVIYDLGNGITNSDDPCILEQKSTTKNLNIPVIKTSCMRVLPTVEV